MDEENNADCGFLIADFKNKSGTGTPKSEISGKLFKY
jgi:hypothetical protein